MALGDTVQVLGLTSDMMLWQVILLTLLSLAVGVLGGLVGLALGTVRLPALLPSAIGIACAHCRRYKHTREHAERGDGCPAYNTLSLAMITLPRSYMFRDMPPIGAVSPGATGG